MPQGRDRIFDLAAVYDSLFEEYQPYDIYLKTLYECFYDEVEPNLEEKGESALSLTNFQKHGVIRAKNILKKYKGVLVADTVGLGKTFIAGAIMQHYFFTQRQKVMLIVPASMIKTWQRFLKVYELSDIQPMSYEAFAKASKEEDFQHKKNRYQLVVIDEAHNYRNPDTKARAEPLRQFLETEDTPSRDLVLLTATPVNNSTADLQTLFGYFLEDNALAAHKTPFPSLKAFFRKLKKEENDGINTKRLQPLIDAVTVKRTRQFVKKYYPDAELPDANGNMQPVTFPEVKLKTVNYNFDEVLPEIFDEIEDILSIKNGKPPKLTLAIYQVGKYLLEPEYDEDGNPIREEPNIIGLLRSLILKRFESSLHAFCRTLEAMCEKYQNFLQKLEEGKVRKTASKRPPPSDSDEENSEEETDEEAANYDCEALRRDVENDLQLLELLINLVKPIPPEQDPKLIQLVEELAAIAEQAESNGGTERQKKDNRKVLVFSYYKDTARWIYDFLTQTLPKDPRLSAYKGNKRLLYTSGSDDRAQSANPDKAAQLFSPETSAADPKKISAEEECDILVTTDVLSEGKNLQQCRHIISYDLPWNPMRLIQRHGRIDRLLSQHKAVFMRTFFPANELDKFLDLENKVRKKLSLADAATGVEVSPIEGGAESARIYSERREELERLEKGDASVIAAGKVRFDVKTAEEYRQTLLNALEDPKETWRERLLSMPFKVGSGKFADKNGHFFCAKVDDCSQAFLRFVPSGAAEVPLTDFNRCLELLECDGHTERVLSDEEWRQAFPAWKQAQQSVVEEWNVFAKENSYQSNVAGVNKAVANFLLTYHPLGVGQEELSEVVKKLKMPWRQHDETDLKKIWKQEKKRLQENGKNAKHSARNLYNFVDKKKMKPFVDSKRYECINEDCVRLVCWMSFRKE